MNREYKNKKSRNTCPTACSKAGALRLTRRRHRACAERGLAEKLKNNKINIYTMKKFIVVLIIICGTINVHAQNEKRNYLGGHVSFGKSDYSREGRIGIDAANRVYTGKNYFTLGFDYSHRDSGSFEAGTGISVTSNDMILASTHYSGGGGSTFEYDESFFMFSIPVNLKLHFLKYLFVGAGLSFNYHPRMGYTWGVGGKINVGAEYTFNSGMSVSISPEMQSNILNLGLPAKGSIGIDKLTQKGINIGLGYRF